VTARKPANTSCAVRRCFAACGYAATSDRLIAEETGLTAVAIYHHFGRKKDLMLASARISR
jgi:AcrR family transcriptional regulator